MLYSKTIKEDLGVEEVEILLEKTYSGGIDIRRIVLHNIWHLRDVVTTVWQAIIKRH